MDILEFTDTKKEPPSLAAPKALFLQLDRDGSAGMFVFLYIHPRGREHLPRRDG